MAEIRTIDNLGEDASVRWAQAQEYGKKTDNQEILFVTRGATSDTVAPSTDSHYEELFHVQKKNSPWARFPSPDPLRRRGRGLFSHQLIPSLGPDEALENLIASVHERAEGAVPAATPEFAWQLENEKAEASVEGEKLTTFLSYVGYLDKILALINGLRSQFSKG